MFFSVILILLLLPVMFFIGVAIKIDSAGSVIFKQKRMGKDGKVFICYKFRTMLQSKEADSLQAYDDDPRITPLGRFLRVTSLDELPQFYNVLKGEMSIVGPRPHMLLHTEYYSNLIPNYNSRLSVLPGITGWAQIHNLRGETHNADKMRQRVEHDLWYIRNWSMALDMRIMFRTIKIMLQ